MSQKLLPGGVPSAGYGSINNNALILDIVNWTTHYSVEASRVYWYNRVTGVTTYDRPECLSTPVGLTVPANAWIENKDDSGKLYWGNGNESSWEQPAEHKAWDDRVKAIIASSVANDTSRLNIPPPPPPPPSGTTPGLPKSTPSGTQSQGQILPPNRYQNTSPVVNNIPSVSPNPTTGLPTPAKRTMQIFKNERYSLAPLPAKWSSEALLPSDRMSYSDDKGFESWLTLEEVNDAYDLRDPGWNWDFRSEWALDPNDADKDGWQFSSDFPGKGRAAGHWHSSKQPHHWVRRQRYTRLQIFDQADYDRESVEFAQKEKEKKEKAEMYRKNPGLAIKDAFKELDEKVKKNNEKLAEWSKKTNLEIKGFPAKVIEDATNAAIEKYFTNPLLDMQRAETKQLLKYVDEGKDSWRLAGFVCSLLLILVSFMSIFVNIVQLNVPYAVLNLFTLAFGLVSVSLEYNKDHWLTKDLVNVVEREAKFLSRPYGRAGFYFFVGLMLACQGYILDFIVGLLLVAVGGFIFYSSYKMYAALALVMTPTKTRLEVLRLFQSIAGKDRVIDSCELANLFMALGQPLNKYEIEAALFALDENGDGKISQDEFCYYWKTNVGFAGEVSVEGYGMFTTFFSSVAGLGALGLIGFSIYRNALNIFS